MSLTGPLPENIRRCLPKEERVDKFTLTNKDIKERSDVKREKDLQNQIEQYFRMKGVPVFRQRMDKKSNMVVGCPDFIVCLRGQFWAFEAKVGANDQTEEQRRIEGQIIDNEGKYFVVRSLAEVVSAIKHVKL